MSSEAAEAKKESEPCWGFLRILKGIRKRFCRCLTFRRLLYKKILPTWLIVLFFIIVGIILCCFFVPGVFFFLNSFNGSGQSSKWNLVVDLCTLAMLAFAIRQVMVMKTASTMDISHQILKANKKERTQTPMAINSAIALKENYLDLKGTFGSLLEQDSILYKYSYHYEYIGQLVYRNQLDFDLVFDTITFPDEVFLPFFSDITTPEEETKKEKHSQQSDDPIVKPNTLIELIRLKEKPDIWLGLEYLYRTYELKRAFNARLNPRRKDEPSKASNEHNTDKGSQTAAPRSFHKIKADWIKIYNQMPL